MDRVARYMAGCITHLSKRCGMARHITIGLAAQAPMVGKRVCIKIHGHTEEGLCPN